MQRRNFMKGFGLIGMGKILPFSENYFSEKSTNKKQSGNSPTELLFFKNESNEFKFLNVIGKAHYKIADIGEVLAIRELTDETNPSSFVDAYIKFAESCKNIADNCLKKGFLVMHEMRI